MRDSNAYVRKWYKKNRPRLLQQAKTWRKRNPEKTAAAQQRYTKAHPERLKVARTKHRLKIKYGLTPEQVIKMLQQQKNCCALCLEQFQKRDRKVIDHCHRTGTVRGILHPVCNFLLGYCNDSVERLQQAQIYLQKFS